MPYSCRLVHFLMYEVGSVLSLPKKKKKKDSLNLGCAHHHCSLVWVGSDLIHISSRVGSYLLSCSMLSRLAKMCT